ncbi:metallophosphoesterase [Solidesulfovibrio fructosivorans JJ]]|uniref:Metallophosphoesterase n=1 Tax=Solidesulfovibrio fructosivorans JJ] TaxID=596151 RepID=E1JXX9_SOLFR|nr:metallophosphoesterase [Solidesulfovibrio fructosivorans]EFL50717.1 metallophosphoesterase [Solidesulfovibrio fructosivorans JJ]]
MPSILFCGDCHGEFSHIICAGRKADAIILLGDQTPNLPLPEELGSLWPRTFFILGNHDTESTGFLIAHRGDAWSHNLHGRVEEVGRLRLAGLGGIFRGRVWHPDGGIRYHSRQELLEATPPRQRFLGDIPALHWSSIFPADFDLLRWLKPIDILVTHEAPENHQHGFREIGDLTREIGARLLVHGHHHEGSVEGKIEGEIRVVGLGLREIKLIEF